jgi:hypothetical protein
MRSFAQRLMAYETRWNKSHTTKTSARFDVVDKLRPHLATLMGNGGFRALLSRALVLSKEEVSWLRAVQVKADGTLEGLEALRVQLDPTEFLEGRVVLLGQLLGLLVAFIGPKLTSRLVGEIWPQFPLNELGFYSGDEDENAK